MEKFILDSFKAVNNYTIYTYANKGGSKKASFHLHPKKAFVFVCDGVENLTSKEWDWITSAFIRQAIAQHEYKGGFYQAIQFLYISEPNTTPNTLKLVEFPKF